MSEGETAAAILNTRRAVSLAGGNLILRVRRHRMSEVLEHLDQLGTIMARVVANMPGARATEMMPVIIREAGAPAFGMLAQVSERENGDGSMYTMMPAEIGDLDVEDFADLLLVYTEMHARAIETFREAFARMQSGNGKIPAKALNESSTGSSVPVTPSIPSET